MKISKNNQVCVKTVDNGAIIQSFEEDTDENGNPWMREHTDVVTGETNCFCTDRKQYIDFMVDLLREIAEKLGYNNHKHGDWNLEIKRVNNRQKHTKDNK